MQEVLAALSNLFILIFVVCSMLSLGLNLMLAQVLKPLQDRDLVIRTLLSNFVLVPILAYVILLIIPLEQGLAIGLICVATAAGAAFLPKLVQVAKGDVPFSVGIMVLIMVVTIVYMPTLMPVLLPGVSINPLEIASSLIVTMLLPLAAGMFIKARYEETAQGLLPTFSQVSNSALILTAGSQLILNGRTILGMIGSGAILAAVLLIAGSSAIGYLMGGSSGEKRKLLSLGCGQRNIAAAMLVGTSNFADPNVLNIIIICSTMGLIVLMIIAGEFGKRAVPSATSAS